MKSPYCSYIKGTHGTSTTLQQVATLTTRLIAIINPEKLTGINRMEFQAQVMPPFRHLCFVVLVGVPPFDCSEYGEQAFGWMDYTASERSEQAFGCHFLSSLVGKVGEVWRIVEWQRLRKV